jgi:hypothetical protein
MTFGQAAQREHGRGPGLVTGPGSSLAAAPTSRGTDRPTSRANITNWSQPYLLAFGARLV